MTQGLYSGKKKNRPPTGAKYSVAEINDRGCQYCDSCLSCPFHKCVEEMNTSERRMFKESLGAR